MHNNYFFLKQLSYSLSKRITRLKIGACFSQNKNELIITFYGVHDQFYIKADQNPEFSCLSFAGDFPRAKKNSVGLFPEILDREVMAVRQFDYERAFSIILEDNYLLLFKLFGNFSNVLVFKNDQCIDVFKHNLNDQRDISLGALDKTPDLSRHAFIRSDRNLKKWAPFLGQEIIKYLDGRGSPETDPDTQWNMINQTIQWLNDPNYYVYESGKQIRFTLLPPIEPIAEFDDPLDAVSFFYESCQRKRWLEKEKKRISTILNLQLKKTGNYLKKTRSKHAEITESTDYKQIADILMANLHHIPPHKSSVELFDFYNDTERKIKINPALSPQKNAENYYRKSKNQKIEIEKLNANIVEKEETSEKIKNLLRVLGLIEDHKTLKKIIAENNLSENQARKETLPKFKQYEYMDFIILVGRNAKNNDELTLHYSYKEDLWLHAKDVTGSHVLIKYQSGKNFPVPVIERAAGLAAYYSKNRNMPHCPVIFTKSKYVSKPKGFPPGAVRVDREEIMFV